MNKFVSIFFLSTIFIVSSCKKDKTVEVSTTPAIEFASITPTTAVAYQDKITIVISYKDGDGDLGENTPDAKNLYLTDTRNNVTYQYRISQLAPSGKTVSIQGTLSVELKNTAITDNSSSQTVAYRLYVTDRAGHASNTITTSAITITN
jgi:hypothetical protein